MFFANENLKIVCRLLQQSLLCTRVIWKMYFAKPELDGYNCANNLLRFWNILNIKAHQISIYLKTVLNKSNTRRKNRLKQINNLSDQVDS